MASKIETVAEIVSKVRSGDYGCAKCGDLCDCPNADKIIASIVDRIEAAHKREIAELKSKINDVICENETLRDACGTCSAKREVAELKNKCEEYERQPELMAETAKAALELLKAQESKITELRACLAGALEVVDSTVVNLGIAERARSHEDYKRWRKALAELAKEGNGNEKEGCD